MGRELQRFLVGLRRALEPRYSGRGARLYVTPEPKLRAVISRYQKIAERQLQVRERTTAALRQPIKTGAPDGGSDMLTTSSTPPAPDATPPASPPAGLDVSPAQSDPFDPTPAVELEPWQRELREAAAAYVEPAPVPFDPAPAQSDPEPRVAKPRWRKRSRTRGKTVAGRLSRKEQVTRDAGETPIEYLLRAERPQVRGDCAGGERPCPWVSCKHHLYLDVNPDNGSIKLNFPDLEPWEMPVTCALDVADRSGITLEEVGDILNLTRERIRQVEVRGLLKLKMVDLETLPDLPEGNYADD